MGWADAHWLELDGVLQQKNIDIYERGRQPMFRFMALLYALLIEAIQWAEKDVRAAVLKVLEWPAVTEQRELEESDRMARETMAALGITNPAFGFDPAILGESS